jgi:hypothetical protein
VNPSLHSQVWRYEGHKTLAYYLRRRDCIQALAEDLGVDEGAVVPTVMKHVFEGLSVGLRVLGVHRVRVCVSSGFTGFRVCVFSGFIVFRVCVSSGFTGFRV